MPSARHILLVDDDSLFLATMANALREGGYRVTEARHFGTALDILDDADNKPDLLVTDIVMPKSINGVALSRMARMRDPKMPVVYLTGYDIPGTEEHVFGPLLRKPVDPERLIRVIEAEFARLAT